MKCHIQLAAGLAILLALAGCGGSGGGSGSNGASGLGPTAVTEWIVGGCSVSSSPGKIVYHPAWPAGAGSSASQIIQILDGSGSVIRTESLNRGASDIEIASLPAGVYEMRAQVYSALNGTGTVLGTMRKMVDLCTSTTYVVSPSASEAAAVNAFPPSPSISTLQTVRIVPQAAAATGEAAFALAAPAFTASGPGTVSSTGVVQPTGAGTITVQASIGALAGSSTVTAKTSSTTRSKWTVLVYMNAANDLYSASDLNMNQLEQAAGNSDVRFVVQWKQSQSIYPASSFDGVRRYLVQPDATSTIRSQVLQSDLRGSDGQPLDMGSPQVMNDFIAWGKTNFPADRYCLVIWDHGNGWKRSPDDGLTRGFSYDDQTGSSIDIWEIDQALAGQTFDIIAWDCSLMQMMEVAYQLKTYAPYIVGSEESPPSDGYPYDAIFKVFRDNPDRSTRELTKAFVDGMVNNTAYVNRKITQSSIESAKLDALASSLSSLADVLIANSASVQTTLATVRSATQSYSLTTYRNFRDIDDFCIRLQAASVPMAVRTAAADVQQKLEAAVAYEGHNANSSNSHGLSIDMSPGTIFSGLQGDYSKMRFAADTHWDEYLLQSPAP